MEVSVDSLAWAAGAALSLACSYVPGLRERYAALDGTQKRLVMLALLAVVTLGVFGLGCAGVRWGATPAPLPEGGQVGCTQQGFFDLVRIFGMALWANQGTFLLTPGRRPEVAGAGEEYYPRG